jgi:arginase
VTIALLGVPTNSAGTIDGVARAPQALREAGLVQRLLRDGRFGGGSFVDLGDVRVDAPSPMRGPDGIIEAANLAATLARVREAVANALRDGHRLVVVGGDCPVVIGALAGCADVFGTPPGLLFVDGHEDAWPPTASTTGEAADMELGMLLGRSLRGVEPSLVAQIPRLDPAHVAIVGPRDRAEIEAAGVASLADTMPVLGDDLVRVDPAGTGSQAARRVVERAGDWWLHVDLDVLASTALPAVDYQQAGGLSWSDLTALTGAALSIPGCVGATVTIYNPDLDPDRLHASRIVEFIGMLAEGLDARG